MQIINILWLPLCRIYKFGLNALPSKTIAIPYTCGLSRPFSGVVAGEHSYDNDVLESDDELETETPETPARTSLPRYELPKVPEGYVMNEETTRDILYCKDRDDLEKLLCKYKERSLNAKMKCYLEFATSPIVIDDKDYEFSMDPELITLVESDPFHGYETETIVAHLYLYLY